MGEDLVTGERFVVQKAAGKKWETLAVHDAQADGTAAFAAAVREAPRAFLRLIRLQADPEARGEVYDWTLVSLHDPRRNPVPAAPPAGAPAAKKAVAKRRQAEIAGYRGDLTAYNDGKMIEKGLNPRQPTYGGTVAAPAN